MKLILALVAFMALVSMATAFPADMTNNTEVCKIIVDTGSSMIVWMAWQENGVWQVAMGTSTYKGIDILPKIYTGDKTGMVLVDLS